MTGMRSLDTRELSGRDRYDLLTSLVVPRPIGWISTWDADSRPNLAPFSYYAALSANPMMIGVSVGWRADGAKDTLVNLRGAGAFCANVVSAPFLAAMNETSADVGPEIDEFGLAGLQAGRSARVAAPYVVGVPAVLECEVRREVDLGGAPNTLVIGEVVGVLLDGGLSLEEDSLRASPELLQPVGRLSGGAYAMPGAVRRLRRPGR